MKFTQRSITLILICLIVIGFSSLVAYNTMKASPAAQETTAASTSATGEPAVPVENIASAQETGIPAGNTVVQTESGTIEIDGGASVSFITQLAADSYLPDHPNIQINVGVSGTDPGVGAFTAGNLDIAGLTRQMTPDEAASSAVEFIEVQLAYDASASRNFYLYINKSSLEKSYVKDFVKMYMENAADFVKGNGYEPSDPSVYEAVLGAL